MKDYQKRMIEERNALKEKLSKLNLFMETKTYMDLPGVKVAWLYEQRFHMNGYLIALEARIKLENIEDESEE